MAEPNISPGRRDLWGFRWEHAQARLEARHGKKAEAEKHVIAANSVLDDMKDKDSRLYAQQSAFVPYLIGYVELYTGSYKAALVDLRNASQNDAFIQCLLGMTYEKLGDTARAREAYEKAASFRGHNPPAAFAHSFTRSKLGLSATY